MRDTGVILDASALLALLLQEPGGAKVGPVLGRSALSSVNYSEVLTRLVREGETPEEAREDLESLNLEIVSWDGPLAGEAVDLCSLAWTHGLSLGDRACLATARRLKRKVLTAERQWRKLPNVGVEIQYIR